jgi:hypothetical protein
VPRLILEFDDDAAGASDALVALLRPRASANPEPDEQDDDDAADSA